MRPTEETLFTPIHVGVNEQLQCWTIHSMIIRLEVNRMLDEMGLI